MKRILVSGANGQLGQEIGRLSANFNDWQFTFTDIADLDICKEQSLIAYFRENTFDYLINCAGYTAVDKSEEEPVTAELVNSTAPKYLAEFATMYNMTIIHISTDYIFDGSKNRPYDENDAPSPLGVYARTKLQGEVNVLKYAGKGAVIRTSWLYSEFGNNFVKTILRVARERKMLKVVYDQVGTPTYAGDLARTILDILPRIEEKGVCSVFNFSNQGIASWYDFAKTIVDIAGIECDITPVETKDYPLPAKRPFYSVLNKARITTEFGLTIPYWRDSLKICIENIQNEDNR